MRVDDIGIAKGEADDTMDAVKAEAFFFGMACGAGAVMALVLFLMTFQSWKHNAEMDREAAERAQHDAIASRRLDLYPYRFEAVHAQSGYGTSGLRSVHRRISQ